MPELWRATHPDDLYCGGCGRAVDGPTFPDLKSLAADDEPGESDDGATVAMPVTGDGPPPPDDATTDRAEDLTAEPKADAKSESKTDSKVDTALDAKSEVEPPLVVNEATPFNFPPPLSGDTPPARDELAVAAAVGASAEHAPDAKAAPAVAAARPPAKKKKSKAPWFILGGIVILAVIGGLVAALISANNDLDEQKANSSANSEEVANLNTVIEQQQADNAELQSELDQSKEDLATAQADLKAEQDGRAADQADAQKTADELATTQASLEAVDGLFPMPEATFRAADPTGDYAVTTVQAQCTIADCGTLQPMTITVPDKTRVEGNLTNGALTFDGSSYVNQGAVAPGSGPLCNGLPVDSTYQLAFHANGVSQTDAVLAATGAAGTYTETITAGDCAGQFRSYDLNMTKK